MVLKLKKSGIQLNDYFEISLILKLHATYGFET